MLTAIWKQRRPKLTRRVGGGDGRTAAEEVLDTPTSERVVMPARENVLSG